MIDTLESLGFARAKIYKLLTPNRQSSRMETMPLHATRGRESPVLLLKYLKERDASAQCHPGLTHVRREERTTEGLTHRRVRPAELDMRITVDHSPKPLHGRL